MPTAQPTGEHLLATKLFAPPLPPVISRPRLLAQMTGSSRHALTLVSAPPGYGKTTLVVDWLSAKDHAAWLALDPADNDPARFFSYLIAAIQRTDPSLGTAALSLLHPPQFPPVETLMTALVNDLAASQRELVIVLDDYQVIHTPLIHHAVEFLIHHLPPGVQVVLTTREDPPFSLARLRARGQLVEIRAEHLRFARDEAGQWFRELLRVDLDEGSVGILETRTEGWAAGLQLAGASLQGLDSARVSDFIRAFGGSDRYVMDYLFDEVLARQTDEVRAFLRQTAVLDRLNASLCDAVTGRQDSKSILAQLEKANLFLIPLDSQREWYRYHHLFADFLRTEIEPTAQADLYRRAADWHAAHGSFDEAVECALAAKDPETAARWMERVAGEMFQKGQVTTLDRWFQSLPMSVLSTHPALTAIQGWVLFITGQIAAASALAEQMAEASQPGEFLALRAELARLSADHQESERLSRQALARIGDTDPFFRLLTMRVLGEAQHLSGDSSAATQTWLETLELGQRLSYSFAALLPLSALIPNLNRQGRRKEALRYCQQALERYVDAHGQPLPVAGLVYAPLGLLHYEANELDRALDYVVRGLASYRDLGIDRISLGDGEWTLARIQWARGETGAALATVRRARLIAEEASLQRIALIMASLEADFSLKVGDLESAAQWADGAGLALDILPNPSYEMIYFVWARVLLAQKRIEEAQVLLGNLKQFAQQGGRHGRLITVYILQALAHHALGNHSIAVDRLEAAVQIAAPEEYRRAFLDESPAVATLLPQVRDTAPAFVDSLLEGFTKVNVDSETKDEGGGTEDEKNHSSPGLRPPSPLASAGPAAGSATFSTHPLVEPLSDREQQVLRLLAEGKSNAEIAQALVVTVGTAKWHVHHVLEKLGASNRTQAVARARELGLL